MNVLRSESDNFGGKQCSILFTWVKNVSVFKVDFFGGGGWTCYVHYQQFIASPDLLAIHDNSGMWHFLQQFPKNKNLLNIMDLIKL